MIELNVWKQIRYHLVVSENYLSFGVGYHFAEMIVTLPCRRAKSSGTDANADTCVCGFICGGGDDPKENSPNLFFF